MLIRIVIFLVVAAVFVFSIRTFMRQWPHIKATAGKDIRTASQGTASWFNIAIAYLRNRPVEAVVLLLLIAILLAG